jgi:TolB protein
MHAQLKWMVAPTVLVIGVALLADQSQQTSQFELVPKIVFSSNRQNPTCTVFTSLELFLMNPDGTGVQRWTDTEGCTHADYFAALSPDGKRIVFDSTRVAANISSLVSRLFLMDSDGTKLTFLTPGSSATWSSDSKYVAFTASASYYASNGSNILTPIRNQPGAPTIDSDIFVANVDDVIAGAAVPKNITNSEHMIDEDADWSPDGTKIVFTSDPDWDVDLIPPFDYPYKEIYLMNADGTGLRPMTFNKYEERGPAWSPDGSRIAFIARVGKRSPLIQNNFEVCLINADGTNLVQLTDNDVFDGTMTWSPDGNKIIFQSPGGANPTLFYAIDADTTCDTSKPVNASCTCSAGVGDACVRKLTTDGVSLFPHLGQLRVRVPK